MGKTVLEYKLEQQKKYYPNGLPNYVDFKIGDRVKIITPCQDFSFFNEETGVIIKIKNEYLGIKVKFDNPRDFGEDGFQYDFGFEPEDLVKIENGDEMTAIEKFKQMASTDDPFNLFEPKLWKDKIGDSLWHCAMCGVSSGFLAESTGKTMEDAIEGCYEEMTKYKNV